MNVYDKDVKMTKAPLRIADVTKAVPVQFYCGGQGGTQTWGVWSHMGNALKR